MRVVFGQAGPAAMVNPLIGTANGPASRLGGLILTGGAASRMGRDKATLEIAGVRAVDRLASLAKALGAGIVLTAGREDYGHPNVTDATPLGGPVGGVMAGAAALRGSGCEIALVLAIDTPTLSPGDLRPLFGLSGGAAFSGFPLPFVAPLDGLPPDAEAGWPVARLLEVWGVARLPPPPSARQRLKGANTPDEFDALVQAASMAGAIER